MTWMAYASMVTALLFVALVGALWYFQRALIFPRPTTQIIAVSRGQVIKVDVSREGRPAGVPDELVACYFAPEADGWVLPFWHGNADQIGNVGDALGAAMRRRDGLGMFAIEYPGYALMQGLPSEQAIMWTAQRMLEHLASDLRVPSSRVCLFGQSIGTAVALEMAKRGLGAKCVLLSPFTSIPDLCTVFFPFVPRPDLFVLDKFQSRSVAPLVSVPTLILHGTHDQIVPYEHGQILATLIPDCTFVTLNHAGHNDIFAQPHWATFINNLKVFLAKK